MAARRTHAQIVAALERERARELRARLAELRARIASARVERRTQIQTIKSQCRTARQKLRDRCHSREATARATGSAAIAERRSERDATAEERRAALRRLPRRRGPSLAERVSESDDDVRRNIPAEFVPVFDRVRRQIKATPKLARWEAFLHWVHEHPEDVVRLQTEQADRDVARLVAEHEAAEREAYEARTRKLARARPRPRARRARASGDDGPIVVVVEEEVPF